MGSFHRLTGGQLTYNYEVEGLDNKHIQYKGTSTSILLVLVTAFRSQSFLLLQLHDHLSVGQAEMGKKL